MKQFFLAVSILVLAASTASAQDYKKQLKTINKNLGLYYLDPVTNKASLASALTELETVMKADDAKADPLSWISKGQIYNEIAKAEMIKKVADPAYNLMTPEAALVAYDAFQVAMNTTLPGKKPSTKDAILGIQECEDYLNNIGITHFQVQDYNNAFKNFAASLKAGELLVANKAKTRLVDTTLTEQTFYTGVCGYYGENKEASMPYFQKLYDSGKAQPLVYEALFTMTVDKDETKGMSILEAGRKANPDDSGLLFAEINYYLKANKLDILVNKLKAAIAKEPNNVSVYSTLGNVYDQLNQKENAAGNPAKAEEYFNQAFDYYNQALKIDPKNFDAFYSQGQLYYNKAAGMTTKINELSNDYSSAGTKKYNALKAEMDGFFLKALPFFLEAEKIDPADTNTMIALKEIYARDGKLDKSAEYKAKLEKASKM
jgi:tetratricopeptide (TPR) repeat protein